MIAVEHLKIAYFLSYMVAKYLRDALLTVDLAPGVLPK